MDRVDGVTDETIEHMESAASIHSQAAAIEDLQMAGTIEKLLGCSAAFPEAEEKQHDAKCSIPFAAWRCAAACSGPGGMRSFARGEDGKTRMWCIFDEDDTNYSCMQRGSTAGDDVGPH